MYLTPDVQRSFSGWSHPLLAQPSITPLHWCLSTIVGETAESLFVGFDGEMHKLHNIRAYEAVHLLAGEGENPEHTQLPLLLHRWLARLTPSRPEMVTMIMALICLGISQGLLRWTLMVTTVRKHRL